MESIEKFGFKLGSKLGIGGTAKSNKAVDEVYTGLKLQFDNNEKLAANFHKHVSQLIENFHAMSTILHFLAEDVRDIYAGTEFEDNAKKIMTFSQDIDKKCVIPFQDKTTPNVLDQVKQFQAEFVPLKKLHDARSKAKTEQEFYSQKVASLAAKQNNKNPMELPKAKEKLQLADEEYEKIDLTTKQEFQALIDKRIEVYNPSMNILLDSIAGFYADASKFSDVLKQAKVSGNYSAPKRPQLAPVASSSGNVPPAVAPRPSANQPVPAEFQCEWFYLDDKVAQQGPITFADMKQKFKSGEFNPDTYVFGGEMSDWAQVKTVPKLVQFLSS